MNLKIDMYIRVPRWDNGLVDQKGGKMKPVKATKQGQFGYGRTPVIRRDGTRGKVPLAEIDPDFGFESSRGVYSPMDAAPDRIELPTD